MRAAFLGPIFLSVTNSSSVAVLMSTAAKSKELNNSMRDNNFIYTPEFRMGIGLIP